MENALAADHVIKLCGCRAVLSGGVVRRPSFSSCMENSSTNDMIGF